MRIRIIDAFAERPFAGNPAGVCVLDGEGWPDEGWMRRVASELNLPMTAFAHPLPGPIVLGLTVVALLAAVVAFDRLGPVAETDGALTLSTAAVIGTAIIFWTSNAVHPDFQTLIGSAIFGGPLGFAAGALLWWMAKRLIVRPAR